MRFLLFAVTCCSRVRCFGGPLVETWLSHQEKIDAEHVSLLRLPSEDCELERLSKEVDKRERSTKTVDDAGELRHLLLQVVICAVGQVFIMSASEETKPWPEVWIPISSRIPEKSLFRITFPKFTHRLWDLVPRAMHLALRVFSEMPFSKDEVFWNYQRWLDGDCCQQTTVGLSFVWQHRSVASQSSTKRCFVATPPRVFCAIPVLSWQHEEMQAVINSWGRDCDELRFYVISEDSRDAWTIGAAQIVNVMRLLTDTDSDESILAQVNSLVNAGCQGRECGKLRRALIYSFSNVQAKVFGSLASAIMETNWEWFCRLDTDTLFFPERFRKLATREDVACSWAYLGLPNWETVYRDYGNTPESGAGICISRDVSKDLVKFVARSGCDRTSSGTHYDDIALGQCFQQMRLFAHPLVFDEQGRSFFNVEPHIADIETMRKTRVAPKVESLNASLQDWIDNRRVHHLLLCEGCEHVHPRRWNARESISYHDYKIPAILRSSYAADLVRIGKADQCSVVDLARCVHDAGGNLSVRRTCYSSCGY